MNAKRPTSLPITADISLPAEGIGSRFFQQLRRRIADSAA
jgi:hypothetical protein